MTESDRDTLVQRLIRQRELLNELDGLAERQEELVRSEDAEPLLALLAERQCIVDEVVELGRELDDELADVAIHPDPAVQALREQIEAAAGRIATRDNRHRVELEGRRRSLSAELAGVGRGRSAMAAYSARPRQPEARFKDTEA